MRGVPLDQAGNITIRNLFDLLHPFALWMGALTAVLLALHGAVYLNVKTTEDIQERIQTWIPWLMGLFAVMAAITVFWMYRDNLPSITVYAKIWPLIFPLIALLAFIGIYLMLKRGKEFYTFVCSALLIAFALFSVGVGLFPNLLMSTTDAAYNLTIYNSASQPNSLTVMLIVAVIGMPFVLLYSAGVYYIFRGEVPPRAR